MNLQGEMKRVLLTMRPIISRMLPPDYVTGSRPPRIPQAWLDFHHLAEDPNYEATS